MRYSQFESIMSAPRMSRYQKACNGNTKKAMTLYRKNLQLSQEFFTVISCFEIALRNAIDQHCQRSFGQDWLRDSIQPGGIFDSENTRMTKKTIEDALVKLHVHYSHSKLVAELGFGFWRYMFAPHQYLATGRNLLKIFTAKPASTPATQYNHTYIFNQLMKVNNVRNRISHHEPICFSTGVAGKDTRYVRQQYALILKLFRWMSINERALLYGLDHINAVCNEVDALQIEMAVEEV